MFVLEGIEVGFNQEQDKWTIRGNQMQDFRTAGTEVVDVPTEDRLGGGGKGWWTRGGGSVFRDWMFFGERQQGQRNYTMNLHMRQAIRW